MLDISQIHPSHRAITKAKTLEGRAGGPPLQQLQAFRFAWLSFHTGNIGYLGATHGTYGARPLPISGALENFGIADIDPAMRKTG
jgi:hypothetical protein